MWVIYLSTVLPLAGHWMISQRFLKEHFILFVRDAHLAGEGYLSEIFTLHKSRILSKYHAEVNDPSPKNGIHKEISRSCKKIKDECATKK